MAVFRENRQENCDCFRSATKTPSFFRINESDFHSRERPEFCVPVPYFAIARRNLLVSKYSFDENFFLHACPHTVHSRYNGPLGTTDIFQVRTSFF